MTEIGGYLTDGVKVIWFGTADDVSKGKDVFRLFTSSRMFQAFESTCREQFTVIDGDITGKEALFESISRNREFNSDQYKVEHSRDKNLIIEASAGTGKTAVMVDRIMFLLHTERDLEPSEISMITFTNEATNQMNDRLQRELMTRYHLTRKQRYLELLEKQSQMNISTIHSFALRLLKKLGLTKGLTKNVSVGSFRYEIDRIIDESLDSIVSNPDRVDNQLGMSLYQSRKLNQDFWDKTVQKGLGSDDLSRMDWGDTDDTRSELVQQSLIKTLTSIDDGLHEMKMKKNEIPLSDLLRDLNRIIDAETVESAGIHYKHIFVDEFQDSDDSQISAMVKLSKLLDSSLFVVGDVKQSIYRFRGADDSAFRTLERKMRETGSIPPARYSLSNNYRTSPEILKTLDNCFSDWRDQGLIPYGKPVYPCRKDIDGEIRFKVMPNPEDEECYADDLAQALEDLKSRVDPDDVRPSDKVVVLTRTNKDLFKVSDVCRRHHIPVIVKQEGSFYISDAVRDFFSMISSHLYCDPAHMFNYLLSPYSDAKKLPDISDLIALNGDENNVMEHLSTFISDTSWKHYDSAFRKSPLMAVVEDITNDDRLLENYARIQKSSLRSSGWDPEKIDKYVFVKTKQYKADLDKLLEIIRRNSGPMNSNLYSLHGFLELMIQTNRTEEAANPGDDEDYECVYCMTVHKSKGLEFDTVFIPYTNKGMMTVGKREILFDNKSGRIGWIYTDKNGVRLKNNNYMRIRPIENTQIKQEESRILYVALTRTIRNLNVYVPQKYKANSWGDFMFNTGAFF